MWTSSCIHTAWGFRAIWFADTHSAHRHRRPGQAQLPVFGFLNPSIRTCLHGHERASDGCRQPGFTKYFPIRKILKCHGGCFVSGSGDASTPVHQFPSGGLLTPIVILFKPLQASNKMQLKCFFVYIIPFWSLLTGWSSSLQAIFYIFGGPFSTHPDATPSSGASRASRAPPRPAASEARPGLGLGGADPRRAPRSGGVGREERWGGGGGERCSLPRSVLDFRQVVFWGGLNHFSNTNSTDTGSKSSGSKLLGFE